MINKAQFQKTVLQMAASPKDPVVRDEYFRAVQHLSEIIAKSYKARELEDYVQDLIEYAIIKRLHERIDPARSAFSYYWKSLGNHVWAIQNKARRNPVHTFDMWENSYGDDGEGENMIRRLAWNLEDYDEEDISELVDNPETVEVIRGKRGRPRTKAPGEKASHWEYLFKLLVRKRTMTEAALLKQLPSDKVNSLKNPEKSILYYMRAIANREGYKLSVSDDGNDTIYMVVGGDKC